MSGDSKGYNDTRAYYNKSKPKLKLRGYTVLHVIGVFIYASNYSINIRNTRVVTVKRIQTHPIISCNRATFPW